jgi:type IV secretory pathway VirB2 component (pilin)
VSSKSSSQLDSVIDWTLFWLFMAGLAWVPYWYASNDLIAWGLNAVLFPGLAILYEISLLLRGKEDPVGAKKLWLPLVLFFAVVVWIVVQTATWGPSWWHHPIWLMTEDAVGHPIEASISVNRDLTTLALERLVTAASVLWLAIQLCHDRKRATYLVGTFVVIVSGYSAYGLIDFGMGQPENSPSRGYLNSTFVNRNHFATYAGMGLVAILGLILRIYQRELIEGGSLRLRIGILWETLVQKTSLLLGCGFLVLVALLLTGSRGAVVATGLGVSSTMLPMLARVEGKAGKHAAVIILAIAIVGVALLFGDSLMAKLAQGGISDQNRYRVYAITVRSIFDAPFLGYGYGTFADVFPMFRDRSLGVLGTWEQAHNTYLEIFQGLGLVFGATLIASVASLVFACVKAAKSDRTTVHVALGVSILVGTHAFTDFSLQIQAVTLTYMALLGAGVAQAVIRQ